MVSYMDIVTLLLTFFVLLFVYTRTTAPDAAAATSTRVSPPQAEAQREHDKGRHARAQPTAPPTADLVSLVETPLLGPTIRFGDAAVTNPTVTVVVEAESVGSPSPESEVAVEGPRPRATCHPDRAGGKPSAQAGPDARRIGRRHGRADWRHRGRAGRRRGGGFHSDRSRAFCADQ